ncbi:MAG: ABC transporter ATP-binding protein [Saprospiraceae bacterium]|nr:ABC transporter ATP-binding protein [Bacteroidia bacterium]NNK89586.1 ABC transporter ATP-binding protein [Saprospiraceae bacterium]
MLKGENIWKSFDDLEVLKGVNLSIDKGSITSIVGKSGTGKSTLLHILGTLDKPDKGKVVIGGIEVSGLNNSQLAEFRNEKIGFVFQFHHLITEFTALENVGIPALINGKSRKYAFKEAEKLLDYLGLSARLEHKPNELSGGEQQRVAVARALVNNPLLVFADEPTGNLDTETSTELHNLFVNLKEELGQTFIIVTHNQELAALSDRRLEMVDGKVVEDIE